MLIPRDSSLSAFKALLPAVTFALAAIPFTLHAQTEKVIHSFCATGTDGTIPKAGLISDSKGNLYGTTYQGGANNGGAVFELTPAQGGAWTEKVLYSFGGTSNDGFWPYAGLVFDSSGNLYGTTFEGGGPNENLDGTVFELTPTASGAWSEQVLYSFGTTSQDGGKPVAGLTFDNMGNLYGTTFSGGANGGYGTVFELLPTTGSSWTEKVLYTSTTNGGDFGAGVVLDAKGNLYGTTEGSGTEGNGSVFELTPVGGGAWTEQLLISFTSSDASGFRPEAGLIFDAKGNLYGTNNGGGANGAGTAFELSPGIGGDWTTQVLHSFKANSADGSLPQANLTFDAQGNLYGTTFYGGTNGNYGTVFELTPTAGGGWAEKLLHSFTNDNGADGYFPSAGLILDSGGNLYGTTQFGGANGCGTVFEIEGTNQPTIVLSPTSLPSASVATIYSQTLTSAGGTAPYTYAITKGALPSGLSLSTSGLIAGTAGQTAAASFTVTATDSSASPGPYTGSQAYTLTISQGVPMITWTAPASIAGGTALSSAQLNATASVPGTFVYSPAAGTILSAGSHTLSVMFTPTDTADYTSGTATVSLTVTVPSPTITWQTPAAITYGTALGGTQLDATASVAGSFAYTPGLGQVLGAGAQTLSTTFTPSDTSSYSTETKTVPLTVNQAALTITASNATRAYGAANPVLGGTTTGAVNGDAFTVSGATTATTSSNPGTYSIVPLATGTDLADYVVTATNGTLTVTKAGSGAVLSSSNASSNLGAAISFTATVTSATTGTPSGTVTFLDGATTLGTGSLNASGVATYATSSLSAGTHSITASYPGSTEFASSTTTSLSQVIVAPDFSVAANPSTLTIAAGQSGTAVFTVTPIGGFTQTVQFTCSGLPPDSTCSFAPSTLTPTGAPVTTTLTIATDIQSAFLTKPRGGSSMLLAGTFFPCGLVMSLLLCLSLRKTTSRRWPMLPPAILFAGLVATWAFTIGCGGTSSGGSGPTTPITPAGTSTVTVNAASSGAGGTSHIAALTMTITN